MINGQNNLPIGVFDSGAGGISVLAELIRQLPGEKFLYLADSANAPYGTKGCECVRNLSVTAARILLDKGIKALVVACNTATSVAIKNIRNEFDIPVIGMEPAIKPAVEAGRDGNIVVMATPLTLKEDKFNNLYSKYNEAAPIIPVPCPGLAELIESEADSKKVQEYLLNIFKDVNIAGVSTIVLGCTHYCFIKKQIQEFAGEKVLIIDGNAGTARHLNAILQDKKLLNSAPDGQPVVELMTTGDAALIVPVYHRFLETLLGTKVLTG